MKVNVAYRIAGVAAVAILSLAVLAPPAHARETVYNCPSGYAKYGENLDGWSIWFQDGNRGIVGYWSDGSSRPAFVFVAGAHLAKHHARLECEQTRQPGTDIGTASASRVVPFGWNQCSYSGGPRAMDPIRVGPHFLCKN